jgi:hypothetical protein
MATTTPEVAKFRKRIQAQKGIGGQGTWGGRENFNNWNEGRGALIQFLKDLTALLKFLVENRIPAESQDLFLECLTDATARVNAVITELDQVQTEGHPTYVKLQNAGLTGKSLRLKLREFYRLIKTSPVEAVLKMANTILGSLTEAFPPLELVQEFKETVETRLQHGGDNAIIALNLGGNEKWWEK